MLTYKNFFFQWTIEEYNLDIYLVDSEVLVSRVCHEHLTTSSLATALGWLLEEIHVTWAHLKKKRTRLQLYIQVDEEYCSQSVETVLEKHVTPSGLHWGGVRTICDDVRIIANLMKP
ncbi:hypothetical protein Tco_0529958 [Tanacetum coccineum]